MTQEPPPLVENLHASEGSQVAIRAICWALILAVVAFIIVGNMSRSSAAAEGKTPGSANPLLPILSRYVVGTHALLKAGKSADPLAPLLTQLDDVAATPADKLRVAIVAGEVTDPAAFDRKIDPLVKDSIPSPVREDAQTVVSIHHNGPDAISSAQRQALIEHCGWFGDVALNHGLPDDFPARKEMLAAAQRTVIFLSAVTIGGVIALCGGCVLLVLAIVLACTNRIRLHYAAPPPGSAFLEAFTIYLVGFAVLSLLLHFLLARFAPNTTSLGWSLLLTILLPIAVAWPVVRGHSWEQTRRVLGWHTGRGVFTELGSGVIGYITALPLLGIMLMIALLLTRIFHTMPTHPVMGAEVKHPSQILLLYFLASVWAPIFEETMFRGALFGHLRARHGWWVSAAIVGFIFAAIHPQGPTMIPALGGIGMVLCGLREWRGSILAPMAAHALSNGVVMSIYVFTMM